MTQEQARKIVADTLHNVQKTRSDIDEFFAWFNESEEWSPEAIERTKADLHRWLCGEQGDGFVLLLSDLAIGAKPLTGLTLYNVMCIVHRHEPAVAMVATIRGWDLPEPDVTWCAGLDETTGREQVQ